MKHWSCPKTSGARRVTLMRGFGSKICLSAYPDNEGRKSGDLVVRQCCVRHPFRVSGDYIQLAGGSHRPTA
jgi:hypothetical protein